MGTLLSYVIVLVLLLAAELFYFRIADRFNIIDKPNERSSHNYITIRGGGDHLVGGGVAVPAVSFLSPGVVVLRGHHTDRGGELRG